MKLDGGAPAPSAAAPNSDAGDPGVPPRGEKALQVLLLASEAGRRLGLVGALAASFPLAQTRSVEDSRSAIRALTTQRFDLILGVQTADSPDAGDLLQLLRRNPVLGRKPVVLLAENSSAYSGHSDPFLRVLELNASAAALTLAMKGLVEAGSEIPGLFDAPAGPKLRDLLFLSNGASLRSAIAEGLARARFGARYLLQSAGHKAQGLHPLAIRAMDELGLDIRSQASHTLRECDLSQVDLTVNLCFGEPGPLVPGRHIKRYDWPVPDPLRRGGSEDEQLERVREARDSISRRLDKLAAELRF